MATDERARILEQKAQEFEKLNNKEEEEGMVKIDAFNQVNMTGTSVGATSQ